MVSSILKNFTWVFGAQFLVLIISIVRAVILPKYLSIDGFGYWEIYWFYSSYAGVFCFGYNDGIYLKYGECNYSQLPRLEIRSANRLLLGMLSLISAIGFLVLFLNFHSDEAFSFSFVLLNIPVVCCTGILIYTLQITNQFKKYSFYSTIDKLLVVILIVCLIFLDDLHYKYIVIADFVGRLLVIGMIIFQAQDLIFGKVLAMKDSFRFLWENVSVGIKLMIANLMGMLLIGTGKMIVQIFGDISEFAIYSFGISITGLILTAVTAISLVLYPSLKRIPSERYPTLFIQINSFTRLFGVSAILLYFPCVIFIEWFYPKYISIIPFLNIFFLIVYTNIKISVLTNTFFNVLRREKDMLKANILCVLIFATISFIGFSIDQAIWIIAFCTFVALAFRAFYSESFLSAKLKSGDRKYLISEIAYLLIFLASTAAFSFATSLAIVIVSYIIWNCFNFSINRQLAVRFKSLIG